MEVQSRGQWASRLGFILAAVGSAVGLGNIWKFPYITGQNGGGAFVLVYLFCIAIVGLPIMIAELMIGRQTQLDAVGAFEALEGQKSPWKLAGWLSVATAFIILSYYAVVAGWTLQYVWLALEGAFNNQTPEEINSLFGSLIGNGPRQVVCQLGFLVLSLGIVIGGVRNGVERWSKILMPVLFVLLLILFGNAMLSDGAIAGLRFMFYPDFSKLSSAAVLEAMGHSFYTLSLGMAIMITYGSYLNKDTNIVGASLKIIVLDTAIALIAGLAIFPIVFAVGMEPAAGPGLVFKTIPIVFSQLPGGHYLAIVFFLLIAFAALTSTVSLLEAQVSYVIDKWEWKRSVATAFLALLSFIVGIPSALSYNVLADKTFFGGRAFFDAIDLLASNYLLPASGLLLSIYVGWFWKKEEDKRGQLHGSPDWVYGLWLFMIRFVSPLAVAFVFYAKIKESGLIDYLSALIQ